MLARANGLPQGSVLVPCAGPGHELAPLATGLPERAIAASDLSQEMVALARARNARFGNVSVARGDATALAPSGPVAGLLSSFGLQLLPDPPRTLESWIRLLAPGGVAVIVYWPPDTESSGPFHELHRLLRKVAVRSDDWDDQVVASALRAGGRVLCDRRLAFSMRHDDAASVWTALTGLGPLRALALTRGQALVDTLGAEFLSTFPPGPIEHLPQARLLVLERP